MLIVYHSADYDGIFCREIAKHFLGPAHTYVGWNFGNGPITQLQSDIIVLDLPPDEPFGLNRTIPNCNSFTWIDHHATSIEKFKSFLIPGNRIDGVAACRLAWQWFCGQKQPTKEDYVARLVDEPYAVRLVGEYDIWDKRDPNVDIFQCGLQVVDFDLYLLFVNENLVRNTIINGVVIQKYQDKLNANIVKHRSFIHTFEGIRFLTLNTARCNSLTFKSLDETNESKHDALMGFYFNGKVWVVSMYHSMCHTQLDLSKIAVKYGGGGHKYACGFQCTKLPFV